MTAGAERNFFGQTAEIVTFLSDAGELDVSGQTSTPLKTGEGSYGKRIEFETFLESGRPPKIVAVEIGDRSEEEKAGVLAEIGTAVGIRSCISSGEFNKNMTEFGVSQLEVMGSEKADEMGPCLNVV